MKNSEALHPDMDWIIGTWEGGVVAEGIVSIEVWSKVSADHYAAEAESRHDGNLISKEHMEISILDDHHCLIIEHGGSEPVVFDFISEDDSGFVSRNEENEFPKQIEYELVGDELVATISDGGPKMEFRFKKAD